MRKTASPAAVALDGLRGERGGLELAINAEYYVPGMIELENDKLSYDPKNLGGAALTTPSAAGAGPALSPFADPDKPLEPPTATRPQRAAFSAKKAQPHFFETSDENTAPSVTQAAEAEGLNDRPPAVHIGG